MTRVHVWGASGYAAAEAIRLLERHPLVELGALESRSHAGEAIGRHFPALRSFKRSFDTQGSVAAGVASGDVVIVAGAAGEAAAAVPRLLEAGARVVDLSADYRLDESAAYGLTEWNRDEIACSRLVANPGCYPTATLLAFLPLATLHAPMQIVVDAKSGITGAGRNPSVGALFAEVAGDVRAYALQGHRHEPEIERALRANGVAAPFLFTPHVVPIARGMLVNVYALYSEAPTERDVRAAFAAAYEASAFVRVLESGVAPSVPAVAGTNDAEIALDVRGNVVRVLCAIDNLGKGAAGQAVQNLNVMLGCPEEMGLHDRIVA
ncbi:MAG: N-acetyl-gamma-glutamyl-phosphate reductase [Candidatus Tyrphobacter sp.]